jgi:hypothetical protein
VSGRQEKLISCEGDLALLSWDLLRKDFEDIASQHGRQIKIEKTWGSTIHLSTKNRPSFCWM